MTKPKKPKRTWPCPAPVKVDLADKTTWPKGWRLQPKGPGQTTYIFRYAARAPFVLMWDTTGSPWFWSYSAMLDHGEYWLPMPPRPRSKKWGAK